MTEENDKAKVTTESGKSGRRVLEGVLIAVISAAAIGTGSRIWRPETSKTASNDSNEPGTTLDAARPLDVNSMHYEGTVRQSEHPEVRTAFAEALVHRAKREYEEAIEKLQRCIAIEKDIANRGTLYYQIGNCYYELEQYISASKFYGLGLRDARQAGEKVGQAVCLVGIGNTYVLRAASGEEGQHTNLEQAAEHYETALDMLTRNEHPAQYAMAQNRLGDAFTMLALGRTKERSIRTLEKWLIFGPYLKPAINCYEAALDVYSKEEYPFEYALTQNSLGDVYLQCSLSSFGEGREPKKDREAAVGCFKAALEIWTRDEYPRQYARTQTSLGNAYWMILDSLTLRYDRKTLNQRHDLAVECLRGAMEVWSEDENPKEYALAAYRLGMALVGKDIADNRIAGAGCGWLNKAYSLREHLDDAYVSAIRERLNLHCHMELE